MKTVFQVSVPESLPDFVPQLKDAARDAGVSVSAYLRIAAIEKMARDLK